MADNQELLATSYGSGAATAPGSGATVTLWSSSANLISAIHGARYKRIIVTIYSSHVSAADGLQFDFSVDNSNWRNIASYTIAATTSTVNFVAVAQPFLRVRYVNSANVLTTWEMIVVGDQTERAL